MTAPANAQVRTQAPGGGDVRWLGQVGPVTSVKWSSTVPGGADQMSCTLQVSPGRRDPAIQVGRQVQVIHGPRAVWDGQLDEPTPQQDGWLLTAHGAGTFGGQYRALYSGTWGSGSPDDAVNQAVTRGLRWVNTPGIGTPTGLWLGQAPDSASDTITDLLNLICSRGGLTWQVATRPAGNVLSVFPLPATVTRLLVATTPVARTVAGMVNAVAVRYQDTGDTSSTHAHFSTTWCVTQPLIDAYGRVEEYLDLSSAGTMTAGAAQTVGNYALVRYQQVAWGGPFSLAPGQYLTASGAPVALGAERAGEVVRVVLGDFGGQVSAGLPTTFIAGTVEYDDNAGTLDVTPFGSVRTDWQSLVSVRTDFHHARGDPFGLKGTSV